MFTGSHHLLYSPISFHIMYSMTSLSLVMTICSCANDKVYKQVFLSCIHIPCTFLSITWINKLGDICLSSFVTAKCSDRDFPVLIQECGFVKLIPLYVDYLMFLLRPIIFLTGSYDKIPEDLQK